MKTVVDAILEAMIPPASPVAVPTTPLADVDSLTATVDRLQVGDTSHDLEEEDSGSETDYAPSPPASEQESSFESYDGNGMTQEVRF